MRILTVDLTARSRRPGNARAPGPGRPVEPVWADPEDAVIPIARPSQLSWACVDHEPQAVVLTVDSAGATDAFVIRALRADEIAVPVLVIAAEADGPAIAEVLEAGADDVVPAPTDAVEIRARLRALSRRPSSWQPDVLVHGSLRVEVDTHRAADDGTPLQLTAQQLRLLSVLMRHPGRTLTRDQLLAAAWDPAQEATSNVVEQAVSGLRARLPVSGAALRTVRGVGYRLDAPPGSARPVDA